MNPEVTDYIANIQPWQAEICNAIRDRIHQSVPDVQERLQYKKPHFLKDGQYVAVLSPAKAQVSLTVFNAQDLDAPEGVFEADGPPERKTVKIKDGQEVDYDLLAKFIAQAASTL
ncbi:MAG: DUF1801 domain-containing protein [Chloroflexota bacterium]|nr:DUF1801 domain-containing protein [Chloroflexota bacterium]